MKDCIFCKIANKEISAYVVWEDKKHIAFLSIFPNTEGTTVVIPKKHYDSYAFDLSDKILAELIIATKKVAKLLDLKLKDVARTAMVFEGYGVDHVHSKLFPMHGTAKLKKWEPIESDIDKYFKKYEGYISSHDYKKISKKDLEKVLNKLKK